MPPALNHRKSRAGCQRCKARKVKCNEARPKCSACARHKVACSYSASGADVPSTSDRIPTATDAGVPPDPIELRLMHEYMAYTCETLTTAREFWKFDAPLLALKFRYVLDALFALSALHVHRQGSGRWPNAVDSSLRALPWVFAEGARSQGASLGETLTTETSTPESRAPSPASGSGRRGVYVEGFESLDLSRKYFSRALEGHSASMSNLDEQNIKAAFVCANLVSFYSLFTLSEASDLADASGPDAVQWFTVSRGAFRLVRHWHTLVGDRWASEAGSMYGEPNLVKERGELFRPEHRAHLDHLLLPVDGAEIEPADRAAYEDALSYLGLMHKGIVEGFDAPLGTQRRIIAMPSLMPQRFADLVEERDLRAIAILAHVFAIMKLCETRNPWLEGIAGHQLPELAGYLPGPWLSLIEWPLDVLRGRISADVRIPVSATTARR